MSATPARFVIVGQGLAGSVLAWLLLRSGAEVQVVDEGNAASASAVSPGILSPISGQNLVLTSDLKRILGVAQRIYGAMEKELGRTLLFPRDEIRLFRDAKQRALFEKKYTYPEFRTYIKAIHPPGFFAPQLRDPHGSFVSWGARLDVAGVMTHVRDRLAAAGCLVQGRFDYDCVEARRGSPTTIYVFCEGARVRENPWFSWLPIHGTRGQMVDVTGDFGALFGDNIVFADTWALAESPSTCRIGATYEHDNLGAEPDPKASDGLIAKMLAQAPGLGNVTVTRHLVGLRPSTKDKVPFVGSHPDHPHLYLSNGFGSKGSMLIPFYGESLAQHLCTGAQLPWGNSLLVRKPFGVKSPRSTRLTTRAQQILQEHLQPGDVAIDGTCGKGHDTLFLAQCVGATGRVLAFDVQEAALTKTDLMLRTQGARDQVELIHACHSQILSFVRPNFHGCVSAFMFNLGYLPGSDKTLITRPETTVQALSACLQALRPRGVGTIMLYRGHPGATEEVNAVEEWIALQSSCLQREDFVVESAHAPTLIFLRHQ